MGFLGWQCRLRQWAVREEGGRPSPGMRPDIWLSGVSQSSGQLTVLINKLEVKPVLAQFRHIVLKTHDPENRYSGALRFLGERYYQRPDGLGDELTALCQVDTLLVRALLAKQKCALCFDAHNQTYTCHALCDRWLRRKVSISLPTGITVSSMPIFPLRSWYLDSSRIGRKPKPTRCHWQYEIEIEVSGYPMTPRKSLRACSRCCCMVLAAPSASRLMMTASSRRCCRL